MATNPGEKEPAAGESRPRYRPRPSATSICRNVLRRLLISINYIYFDGQSLRIEFGVTRLDDVKPNTPFTGRRYPAQRIALTPGAAADLVNRMQQIGVALTQAGVFQAPPKTTS